MQFNCIIDNHRSTKKGLKITLHLDEKAKKEAMKHLHEFEDMPLLVTLDINSRERLAILQRISEEQRKKIYAILHDIGESTGNTNEDVKHDMKPLFLKAYPQHSDFSLSDCSKELASDFITYLIMFCFTQGIPLKDHPREAFDDIEKWLWLCLKLKICCITGKPGHVHHVSAIGMGRDRRHYDDGQHLKICLSPEKHAEAHTIGWLTFAEKYHVKGILFE